MWSLLSKLLEAVGRQRLPWPRTAHPLQVGDPQSPDHLGGQAWKQFLRPRELAKVFGPREDGPWWPFHCLTLFAALDYIRPAGLGPLPRAPLPVDRVPIPDWLDARTLLFVDLRGPRSVALGAALAVQGCDLVCAFNNWPRPGGLIASENTLAALLRYASWLATERRRPETPAPVAWLCDGERLGTRPGRPGEFDNRYYIEEAVLPGPSYLRERGIARIVYLGEEEKPVLADLAEHLLEYRKVGFELAGARISGAGELGPLSELDVAAGRFDKVGYLLAAGGGFGATVPHPSSGG